MKITPKIEDYLETIYRLSRKMDTVGVSDVAKAREVSVPTARTAVNRLQDMGFLHQKHYGKIILHEEGEQMGREIYRVHRTLRRFLMEVLLLDPSTAEQDACLMEHGLSPETLERLRIFLDVLDRGNQTSKNVMLAFKESLHFIDKDHPDSHSLAAVQNSCAMTLLDLTPGKVGVIRKIGGNGRIRHRILDMGFHIGKKVSMVKYAPLKDPVEFAINGNHISLRREEAKLICISPASELDDQ